MLSFHMRSGKLEIFLPKNQHTQREIIEFWEFLCRGGVKMCQNWTFKVNFLHQKSSESFSSFYWMMPIWEYIFGIINFHQSNIFFISKMMPNFYNSPLDQFAKFNDFLLVYWFLGKILSNFVPLPRKLDNPFCHI